MASTPFWGLMGKVVKGSSRPEAAVETARSVDASGGPQFRVDSAPHCWRLVVFVATCVFEMWRVTQLWMPPFMLTVEVSRQLLCVEQSVDAH